MLRCSYKMCSYKKRVYIQEASPCSSLKINPLCPIQFPSIYLPKDTPPQKDNIYLEIWLENGYNTYVNLSSYGYVNGRSKQFVSMWHQYFLHIQLHLQAIKIYLNASHLHLKVNWLSFFLIILISLDISAFIIAELLINIKSS